MTKQTLSAKAYRVAMMTFVAGIAIGATSNYIALHEIPQEKAPTPTSLEETTIKTDARLLIAKELASPKTAVFSNTRTQFEAPFYVIQEDIVETLRTGAKFNSSYTAAFIKDEKSWAPIYVKQMFK